MNYTIEIAETLSQSVTVQAATAEEAMSIVRQAYRKEQIILSADDDVDTDFRVFDDTSASSVLRLPAEPFGDLPF
jgi:hypothetical protein